MMGVMTTAQALPALLPFPLKGMVPLLHSRVSGPAQIADAAFDG